MKYRCSTCGLELPSLLSVCSRSHAPQPDPKDAPDWRERSDTLACKLSNAEAERDRLQARMEDDERFRAELASVRDAATKELQLAVVERDIRLAQSSDELRRVVTSWKTEEEEWNKEMTDLRAELAEQGERNDRTRREVLRIAEERDAARAELTELRAALDRYSKEDGSGLVQKQAAYIQRMEGEVARARAEHQMRFAEWQQKLRMRGDALAKADEVMTRLENERDAARAECQRQATTWLEDRKLLLASIRRVDAEAARMREALRYIGEDFHKDICDTDDYCELCEKARQALASTTAGTLALGVIEAARRLRNRDAALADALDAWDQAMSPQATYPENVSMKTDNGDMSGEATGGERPTIKE